MKKYVESLLLTKKLKKCSKLIWTVFKRRTWTEEHVLVYNIWTGNARILNMPEYVSWNMHKCGQIWIDISKLVNMSEYVWNILFLNKLAGL